jgi:N-acetylglutamate synthase-like GNAT family acetyltransferase
VRATPIDLPTRVVQHGRTITFRVAGDDDVDGVLALYERLGPEDRHRRFFASHQPRRSFVEHWIEVGRRGGAVIVGVLDDGTIVAEAGYAPVATDVAELAIAVDPDWRGWLGPYLVDLVAAHAAARGIADLDAEVLTTNCAMLAVLKARGCAFTPSDDPSLVHAVISTTATAPSWPRDAAHPRVLIEGASAHWNAARGVEAAGLSVLVCPGPDHRKVHACPLLRGDRCPLVEGADAVVVRLAADPTTGEALLAAHAAAGTAVIAVEPNVSTADVLDAVRAASRGSDQPGETPER